MVDHAALTFGTRGQKHFLDDLRQRLALRVEIRLRSKEKGQIVLSFDSNDDFERLLEVLRGKTD